MTFPPVLEASAPSNQLPVHSNPTSALTFKYICKLYLSFGRKGEHIMLRKYSGQRRNTETHSSRVLHIVFSFVCSTVSIKQSPASTQQHKELGRRKLQPKLILTAIINSKGCLYTRTGDWYFCTMAAV